MTVPSAILAAALVGATEIFVSPDGRRGNDGSAAHPVATLAQAMELVRAVERDEPKTVTFRDGVYAFEEPVVLTENDFDLTIRAEHPGKAILTGAVRLRDWRKDEKDGRLLVADLPYAPENYMRLTFVSSGQWRKIAEHPNLKIKAHAGNRNLVFAGDEDFSSVDFASAWFVIVQEYGVTITPIKEYDPQYKVFTLMNPACFPFTARLPPRIGIRNTRHGLTKPGMWMYETTKRRVTYWPCEGETAENLDAWISRAHSILAVGPSTNVRVEGLVFEGCSVKGDAKDGAITMSSSRRAVIDGCEVRNCADHGILAVWPDHCLVTRSHIHHMGGEGLVYCNGGDASDVTWCEVDTVGLFAPGRGIAMQLSNCRCVGNKVHDTPSSGVVMWSANSVFASNEVYRCMYGTSDGGGLYGGFNNCDIHDNYVHDFSFGDNFGLYCDEGSKDVRLYNNRCEGPLPIHMHCTQYVTVSNNVFKNKNGMRFSFAGSGHGIFCDNKIYATKMPTNDPYLANCDFWGRNEFFLRQADGSYKRGGVLTFPPFRPQPEAFDLPALMEDAVRPIDYRGTVIDNAFVKGMRWAGNTSVRADGSSSPGVPNATVYMCYDDDYLYLYVVRRWNALSGYPGWQNLTSTGWGHCDATRLWFEGGRRITVFPDGQYETKGFRPRIGKKDFVMQGAGTFLIRLALEDLAVKGAKKKPVNLDLEREEGDELPGEEVAETGDAPRPMDVLGCTLKFNATIWVEDLREEKSLFPRHGDDYATGTIRFDKVPTRLP